MKLLLVISMCSLVLLPQGSLSTYHKDKILQVTEPLIQAWGSVVSVHGVSHPNGVQ
jgi:hypothetical protein